MKRKDSAKTGPEKVKLPKRLSAGEERFAQQLDAHGIRYAREVVFAPPRRFRFDFVLASKANGERLLKPIAVEIEGGLYINGGHTRGKAHERDMEKYNLAASKGWFVYRYSTCHVKSGEAIKHLLEVL